MFHLTFLPNYLSGLFDPVIMLVIIHSYFKSIYAPPSVGRQVIRTDTHTHAQIDKTEAVQSNATYTCVILYVVIPFGLLYREYIYLSIQPRDTISYLMNEGCVLPSSCLVTES